MYIPNFFCLKLAVTKYSPSTYSQPTTSRLTWSHASGLQNCNICGTFVNKYEHTYFRKVCVVCGYKDKIKPFKIKHSF